MVSSLLYSRNVEIYVWTLREQCELESNGTKVCGSIFVYGMDKLHTIKLHSLDTFLETSMHCKYISKSSRMEALNSKNCKEMDESLHELSWRQCNLM